MISGRKSRLEIDISNFFTEDITMKKVAQVMTHENFWKYGTYMTWEEIDVKNDPVNFFTHSAFAMAAYTECSFASA